MRPEMYHVTVRVKTKITTHLFVRKFGNYELISVSNTAVTSRDKGPNDSDLKTQEVN